MMPDEAQHRRSMARAINNIMQGKTNNAMQVTLTPNVTSTTVTDSRASINTSPVLVAMTASAAAEMAAGHLYVVPSAGQVVINHINSPVADRTFLMSLIG
jgi:hypothetical protein